MSSNEMKGASSFLTAHEPSGHQKPADGSGRSGGSEERFGERREAGLRLPLGGEPDVRRRGESHRHTDIKLLLELFCNLNKGYCDYCSSSLIFTFQSVHLLCETYILLYKLCMEFVAILMIFLTFSLFLPCLY